MNRHRSAPKTPVSIFITLGVATLVATAGGAMHAVCKNHQVLVEREIDASERRMEQSRLDIQITEVRMDELLDRYELKERLRSNGSRMVALGHGDIVDITPASAVPSVASTDQP
ncbi:MAG: hypothetical protein JWO82_4210 [Akkermansiaceae bacterium]|jgi:hypothetical protein|nr:hypothetical protein [Akkermansiaceae bacterium]